MPLQREQTPFYANNDNPTQVVAEMPNKRGRLLDGTTASNTAADDASIHLVASEKRIAEIAATSKSMGPYVVTIGERKFALCVKAKELGRKNKSDAARVGARDRVVSEAGGWDAEHEIHSDDVMLFDEEMAEHRRDIPSDDVMLFDEELVETRRVILVDRGKKF